LKRLIFCFDGTWNRLDSPHSTNVLIAAESVLPLANDGTAQLIFYDEGVGTDKRESLRGGMFGRGLVKNLADAYRFLVFNYSPGDQIYVFGFSRGAYTARSFVGLVYAVGVIMRSRASIIDKAIELYKQRDDTDYYEEELWTFRNENSPYVVRDDKEEERRSKLIHKTDYPRLQVNYLGVWDTVGALGIPARYAWFSWINRKHKFHNVKLSSFVKRARHAVAIDERRSDFAPTLWENLDEMNRSAGFASDAENAPYQEIWFSGVHSSIGGGGERRGLSDLALQWVLRGAQQAGLVLDPDGLSRVFEFKPDYKSHVECADDPGLLYKLMNKFGAADRNPGPTAIHQVSLGTRRRWLEDWKKLEGAIAPYRPGTLRAVADGLNALKPADYGIGVYDDPGQEYEVYTVEQGDNLSKIAQKFYNKPAKFVEIHKANLDRIDDPHVIYPGQKLRIPKLAETS
jgi:uncharacterized protein (DUF2235 family)